MANFRLGAAALGVLLSVGTAKADVLLAIDNDGSGAARFRITGSYDVTGGYDAGFSSVSDVIGTNFAADDIQLYRITSPVSSSVGRSFAGSDLSAGAILSGQSAGQVPSGLSFSGLFLDVSTLSGGGAARIVSFGAPLTGTLSEDVVTPSIAFSFFNTGVWEWGSYGSAANDGVRLEIGQDVVDGEVPLPAGLPLAAAGLAALGLVCRSGRRRHS